MHYGLSQSIANKLLRVVFSAYFSIAILMTTFHVIFQYFHTEETIRRDLVSIEHNFKAALATAFWELNEEQIDTLTLGIYNLPFVVSLQTLDAHDREIKSMGEVSENQIQVGLFCHIFPIYRDDMEQTIFLAKVRLCSNSSVIFERVKIGFAMILLSAVIKTTVLIVLLLWAFRKHLYYPFTQFIQQVDKIDLDNIHAQKLNLGLQDNNELLFMENAFNLMLAKIEGQKANLLANEYAQQARLEEKVLSRTKELELARRASEQANLSKSEFLANMSHELRTPMHGILSYSKFGHDLYESTANEEVGQYFSKINVCGRRLLLLLDDLLDLSKLEAGKMELSYSHTELEIIVNSCISEQQARLKERQIHCKFNSTDFCTQVECDEGLITQVVTNLLSNAIRYSPNAGEIEIEINIRAIVLPVDINENSAEAISMLQLSIEDQGVGIPDQDRHVIFEKFTQSSQTKTRAGGTGLGLAICKQIVELHGGQIKVVDAIGKGAALVFEIPLQQTAKPAGK